MDKQTDEREQQKRPWWVKITYPFGVICYGILLLVVLLIKLIMICAYPIGALSGILLGGGEPGWVKYKEIVKKLL